MRQLAEIQTVQILTRPTPLQHSIYINKNGWIHSYAFRHFIKGNNFRELLFVFLMDKAVVKRPSIKGSTRKGAYYFL